MGIIYITSKHQVVSKNFTTIESFYNSFCDQEICHMNGIEYEYEDVI